MQSGGPDVWSVGAWSLLACLFYIWGCCCLYLLYIDESGNMNDPSQKCFVLAGLCTFERQGYWIARELDKIAERFTRYMPVEAGTTSDIELHGNPMYGGKSFWHGVPKEDRINAICDTLRVVRDSHISNRIFASVILKRDPSRIGDASDAVEVAFEQIASRFDHFLHRLYNNNDVQRGIMILDKSSYEHTLQSLTRDFREIGCRWGIINNLAEVPLFLDSKASRLIQIADIIAYAVFQKYQNDNDLFFDIIKERFDQDANIQHGLYLQEW